MPILRLFPVVFLGVLVAWAAGPWRARSTRSVPQGLTLTLLTLLLCYTLAFLIGCAGAWWYDNGVREFIERRDRFWAAELGTLVTMPAVPMALGLHALVRAVRKKGRHG